MAVIGSLSVKLGLVTVEWDQATKKAKQDAKDLQKSFDDLTGNVKTLYGHWKTLGGAMSLSAVGMAELLHQTIAFSDTVSDLAKGFDISIAKTLQFRDAIKSSGGNAEGASKMMSTLFSKIEDARGGNESAIAQFEKIGISFEEITKLSPEQTLNRVFDAIAKIGNTYERVKAVKDMLGKQGIGLEVSAVAEKLGMSTAKYEMYAKSIEKVGQVNDDLAATFDNLKIAFADMIAPFTSQGVVSVEKFKAALVALTAGAVVSGLVQIVSLSAKLIEVWKSGAKIQAAMTAMGGIKGMIQLGAAAAAYYAALKIFEMDAEEAASKPETGAGGGSSGSGDDSAKQAASRREINAAQAKVALIRKQIELTKEEGELKIKALDTDKYSIQLLETNTTLGRELATAANARVQALNKENLSAAQRGAIQSEYKANVDLAYEKAQQASQLIIEQREKEIRLIGKQTEAAKALNKFDVQRLELEQERVYMTDYEYRVANENLSTKRRQAELEQQIADARDKLGAGKTFDAEKRRIEELIEAEKNLSRIRMDGIDFDEQRRKSFTQGWGEAVRKFSQDAENYSKLGSDLFTSAIGNMNSAIDNFVKTGKGSFKDLARSIIQDTMAMIMKFQAMQLVMMGLRALGFGGAMPTGSVTMSPITMSGGGIPGVNYAAAGGDISGPTIVGENGPELFIPSRSGTVVPNAQMGQAMSGGPSVVYNGPYIANMSAIDTQSGMQFLAKNKQSVWAANQSAQRSLPVSR